MGGLSVKKKEEMFLRKSVAFAVVFTDSSVDATEESVNTTTYNHKNYKMSLWIHRQKNLWDYPLLHGFLKPNLRIFFFCCDIHR